MLLRTRVYYKEHDITVYILLLIVALVFLLSVVALAELWVLTDKARCSEYAELNQHFEFMWATYNGCLVRTEGMDIWIPVENIRTLIQ